MANADRINNAEKIGLKPIKSRCSKVDSLFWSSTVREKTGLAFVCLFHKLHRKRSNPSRRVLEIKSRTNAHAPFLGSNYHRERSVYLRAVFSAFQIQFLPSVEVRAQIPSPREEVGSCPKFEQKEKPIKDKRTQCLIIEEDDLR